MIISNQRLTCKKISGCIIAALFIICSAALCLAANKNDVKQDSINDLRQLASSGDANAYYRLGKIYLDGVKGVTADSSARIAAKYFSLGAKGGNVASYAALGSCLRHGIGVERDSIRALRMVLTAIKLGHMASLDSAAANASAGSLFDISIMRQCYLQGIGVKADRKRATEFMEMAAKAGDTNAAEELADYYFDNKNYPAAIELYRTIVPPSDKIAFRIAQSEATSVPEAFDKILTLAANGYPPAQAEAGELYYTGLTGITNMKEAARYNCEAAMAGFHKSAWRLASQLINGRGIDRDYLRAIGLLRDFVSAGYATAARDSITNSWSSLPFVPYLKGIALLDTDNYRDAESYFKEAAKKGVSEALVGSAMIMFRDGNVDKAIKELTRLNKKGCPAAGIELARIYSLGKGVEKDYDKALDALSPYSLNPSALNEKGNIYYSMSDFSNACDAYSKAFAMCGMDRESRVRYAECLREGKGCKRDDDLATKVASMAPETRLIDLFTIVRSLD